MSQFIYIITYPWRAYKRLYQGKPWWGKTLLAVATVFVAMALFVFSVTVNLFGLFGDSPSTDEIMFPRQPQASEVYSSDGELIGKFFQENRSNVPYDSISPHFINALIATEDARFYKHWGVDFYGMFSAFKDILSGHPRGASTITQQLVKNIFRMRSRYSSGPIGKVPGMDMLVKKTKEIVIAIQLEMAFSKEDILKMYANTVDFGSNAFGIKSAARLYFNTTPSALTADQAALLVGLLKATSTYNPRLHPDKSLERRNLVLEKMSDQGYISSSEAYSLMQKPLGLNYVPSVSAGGSQSYFLEALRIQLREKCPELDIETDGLKIYTTLNMRMQRYAEASVLQQMRWLQQQFYNHWAGAEPWRDEDGRPVKGFLQRAARRTEAYRNLASLYGDDEKKIMKAMSEPHSVKLFSYGGVQERTMSSLDSLRHMLHFLHAGFMAMEPGTGFVRAWIGDVNYPTWQHDNVTARHQPGSTFKLFVYATAMERGRLPSDEILDDEIEVQVGGGSGAFPAVWKPSNASGTFSGKMLTLREAFSRSVNSVAVRLALQVGVDQIIARARDMGVNSPLPSTPTIALGAAEVSLRELVAAYATVAAGGSYVEPVLVEKITNSSDVVIYEAHPSHHVALSETAAFYMQQLLKAGVSDAGGTSGRMREYIGSDLAANALDLGGKTGTTNAYSDAWYVGVTPNLVGGVWVGGEYQAIHFRTGALGQGSRAAMPIFGMFMQKVLGDASLRKRYLAHFPPPISDIPPSSYLPDSMQRDTLIDYSDIFNDSLYNTDNLWLRNDNEEEYSTRSDNSDYDSETYNH